MNTLKALNKKLDIILDAQGHEWLNQAKLQLTQLNDDLELVVNKLVFFTSSAKRKLGMSLLNGEIDSGFIADIYEQCNKISLSHWSVTDAARILLLTEILASKSFSADELFQLCYRYSDGDERASLLKGLALLKLSDESIPFIIDIARTNSLELFFSLIYKNPWPVVKFPIPAFNQLVLKSLFLGINIVHLEGLRAARNSELGRMADDYVQERLDAGKEIPESIWLAVDASLLTEQGLTAWEYALQTTPSESKHQLALTGYRWQSELPPQLQKIAQSLNNF